MAHLSLSTAQQPQQMEALLAHASSNLRVATSQALEALADLVVQGVELQADHTEEAVGIRSAVEWARRKRGRLMAADREICRDLSRVSSCLSADARASCAAPLQVCHVDAVASGCELGWVACMRACA